MVYRSKRLKHLFHITLKTFIMNKKIIYQVLWGAGVLGFVLFIFLGLSSQDKDEIASYSAWAICFAALWIFSHLKLNNIRDDEDPLNYAKQKAALNYAAEKTSGTKCEFIAKHGIDVYNHFLSRGILHQLRGKDVWELTFYGEQLKKEWE